MLGAVIGAAISAAAGAWLEYAMGDVQRVAYITRLRRDARVWRYRMIPAGLNWGGCQ